MRWKLVSMSVTGIFYSATAGLRDEAKRIEQAARSDV